jgi:hypothetical protein
MRPPGFKPSTETKVTMSDKEKKRERERNTKVVTF